MPKKPSFLTHRRRQAVVVASIAFVALIGASVFFMLQPPDGKDSGPGGRLLSETTTTAGVSGTHSGDAGAGGLRLCNRTASRVGVAIGYKDKRHWVTEGWWNINRDTCETLVVGALVSRYYYVYAIDYDHGGVWGGKALMCTRDKMFTIQGIEDCVARGYERNGFFEVDTGEQRSWTVQLTEPGDETEADETGIGG